MHILCSGALAFTTVHFMYVCCCCKIGATQSSSGGVALDIGVGTQGRIQSRLPPVKVDIIANNEVIANYFPTLHFSPAFAIYS
jgi:hypothetical protein